MEKTSCEVICGAPTTTVVKGLVKEVKDNAVLHSWIALEADLS